VSRGPAFPEGADFLLAAGSVVDIVGRMEVVSRWSEPSALPGLTVAGLAAHLASQVLTVHAAVTSGTAVSEERPVPLLEHYQRASWVRAGLDDPANVAIRETAERSAGVGHGALVASVQTAVDDLRAAFTRTLPAGLPPAIRMPAWEWSLSFEDFLVTRVMEIVVHTDDLAVSVDVAPPILPEAVLGPVLALLVGVSLQRHGQSAVVRALTRSERAPASISAF
jgi:hypothetical protein